MAESGEGTRSLWRDTTQLPRFERLRADADVEVCVIGAGIAGLTTAYLLAREGRQVLVLDDNEIGGGETGNTTAHLSNAFDDRYTAVADKLGADAARAVAESHTAAIQLIGEICERERIECDFRWLDGYLFPGPDNDVDALRAEEKAARAAGIEAVIDHSPAHDPFGRGPALRFPRQAAFQPLQFLAGLARAVDEGGGRICTDTHVSGIEPGARVRIKTSGGATVSAQACIVCTNASISDYVQTHAKSAPYRTFALALEVPRGSVPDALYWDNGDPYVYIRLHRAGDRDLLIVGGEDYKTGQASDDRARLDRLENWARAHFPMAGTCTHRWSGQVVEPDDFLAFIGPNPDGAENVYMIMGDSGQGMTHGVLGAVIMNDLLHGRENPWAQYYDPRRITAGAAVEYVKQNVNVFAQYADYLRPGEVRSEEEIPADCGRLMRRGTDILAVYRDADGYVHRRSAVCTHLKCIVRWNDLEKSWDCPCHGSRFSPLGEVLNGPALSELGLVED